MAQPNRFYIYCGRVLVVVLLCVAFAKPSFSATAVQVMKEKAKQYYWGQRRDQSYPKALELYLRAARLGDAESQFISGGMYYKGLGVEKDYAKAFQLLHEAALNGKSSSVSQKIIAQSFMHGTVVPRDYDMALKWYTLSAKNGNSEAQNELAYMYFTGNGVEQDIEKGTSMFLTSAYNGSPTSQYNVGIIYYSYNGLGKVDLRKAYAWIAISAKNGYQPAITALEYLRSKLSEDEMAAVRKHAASLWEKVSH